MDENSQPDLPYGHFGRAEYFPEDLAWHFARAPHNSISLQPLGVTSVIASSETEETANYSDRCPPQKRHARQIKTLAGDHPELRPASKLLAPLLQVSEAVEHAVNEYEPTKGTLLAFAEIRSAGRHRKVPVAAMATGPTGSILRLMQLKLSNHGWKDLEYPHLQVPWLSTRDSVWRDIEESIQQTCFSQKGVRGNTLLAVRSLQKIQIFQPWHGKESNEGRIGLDLLYTLSSSKEGDSQYVHVSFNHWFPQQIGIVDVSGKWSVLEFDCYRMTKVSKTWSGSPRCGYSCVKDSLDDGWARIHWVNDIETIAVCTRTQLVLYKIADDNAKKMKTVRFNSKTSPVWAVDALILPEYQGRIFILNSVHILVYDVQQVSGGLTIWLQSRIRHFKSPDDLSLRVVHGTEKASINLVIQSSTSTTFSHFRVSMHGPILLLDNPTEFHIEALRSGGNRIQEVHLRPLQLIQTSSRSEKQNIVKRHAAQAFRYYIATVLYKDSTVVEGLFYCFDETSSQPIQFLETPSWERQASKSAIISAKCLYHDDSFVENEDAESDPRALMTSEPSARRRRRPRPPDRLGMRTVNLRPIAQQLDSSAAANTQRVNDLAADIRDILASRTLDSARPMSTLASFCTGELVVDDIQAASSTLQQSFAQEPDVEGDFCEYEEENSRLEVADVPLPRVLDLESELAEPTIPSIFTHLVDEWISVLPAEVPGWVRLAKVSIARRMAVELMLASKTLRKEVKAEEQHLQAPQPQLPTWSLAMRPSDVRSNSAPLRLIPETTALPTPSPTGTPSLVTTASNPSTIHAPSLDRLKQYTTFEHAASLELPRSMRNVLAHWDVNANVEEYDWIDGSKKVSHQNEDEEDGMTEKDRRRAHMRAERHLRRQRREAAASETQRLANSRAKEIFSASQPSALQVNSSQPAAVEGSSQPYSENQRMPASQVLPGRFGGRPPKKKRRVRRVEGF